MKSIITLAFALIIISVHPPLLDDSSVAAAVGYYIAEAWKWAELPILFFI